MSLHTGRYPAFLSFPCCKKSFNHLFIIIIVANYRLSSKGMPQLIFVIQYLNAPGFVSLGMVSPCIIHRNIPPSTGLLLIASFHMQRRCRCSGIVICCTARFRDAPIKVPYKPRNKIQFPAYKHVAVKFGIIAAVGLLP